MDPERVAAMVAVISLAEWLKWLVVNRSGTRKIDVIASRNGGYKNVISFRRFVLRSPARIRRIISWSAKLRHAYDYNPREFLLPTQRLVATVVLLVKAID